MQPLPSIRRGWGALIADPPWRYRDQLREGLESRYQGTMGDEGR